MGVMGVGGYGVMLMIVCIHIFFDCVAVQIDGLEAPSAATAAGPSFPPPGTDVAPNQASKPEGGTPKGEIEAAPGSLNKGGEEKDANRKVWGCSW